MIRPTTIPHTLEELKIEQAISREALRLAFIQHKALAVGLKGVQRTRTISESFDESTSGQTIIDMATLDLLVGSGGVLSHAPRRSQSMLMMVDAFQPVGVTRLAVDSIFMMPHLGVLAQINQKAAEEVFFHDCIIELGPCVASITPGKPGHPVFSYEMETGEGVKRGTIPAGEMLLEPLALGKTAKLRLDPARGIDAGAGKGRPLEATVSGGVVGILFDGRGRPLRIPEKNRSETVERWARAVDAYPG
jgi:hypothetical protein